LSIKIADWKLRIPAFANTNIILSKTKDTKCLQANEINIVT
jgi:hypothetical protein